MEAEGPKSNLRSGAGEGERREGTRRQGTQMGFY